MNKNHEKVIFDFSSDESNIAWNIINDVVMGGLSESKFRINSADSIAIFSGRVSLENNGGFALVRTAPKDYQLGGYQGMIIRVKGDGKTYHFRVRTGSRFRDISYSTKFVSKDNEWMEIKLAFSEFIPTFRGRSLSNVELLKPEKIKQIGFLISDKQAGEFELKIDWIKAY